MEARSAAVELRSMDSSVGPDPALPSFVRCTEYHVFKSVDRRRRRVDATSDINTKCSTARRGTANDTGAVSIIGSQPQ